MRNRGWGLALLLSLLLAGCATKPPQRAYDHGAGASLKTIQVLPMRHAEIDLMIVNNPGYSFGLVGLAIAEANRAPKANWLQAEVAKAGFDPVVTFKSALDAAMLEQGYSLVWGTPPMESSKARTPRTLVGTRKSHAGSSADAQFDINFGFIGYASAGSSDKAPYRPTVVLSAKLVSADGKRTLFEDQIIYNPVFPGNADAITLNADDRYRYPDFDDLKAAGSVAVEGLTPAFTAVADELAKQLRR